jgi:hypothetical protein
MGQIIRYGFTPPPVEGWDVDRYMATTFVTALREAIRDNGWMEVNSGRESGGTFLVGYRDRLYCVQSDFQIGRSLDGYDAVGCGGEIALGSLWTTRSLEPDPRTRARLALSAAAAHSAGVAGPFTIVQTGGAS